MTHGGYLFMKRIIFFGDSLTAGYGLSRPGIESFPALLQQKIIQLGFEGKVENAGISGDTTESGLRRLGGVLREKPDVFLLQLGVNDMIRGHDPLHTSANLQQIIDQVRLTNPQVRMAMLGMELPAWVPGKHSPAYRQIYRDLAGDNQMAFVPFLLEGVAGKRHLNLPDGLHPNAAGYRVIAELVWGVFKDLLSPEPDGLVNDAGKKVSNT